MQTRIGVTEETKKKLMEIAEKSIKVIAELQLLEMQGRAILEDAANQFGILECVEGYDFTTHEFVVNIPSDTGEVEETVGE